MNNIDKELLKQVADLHGVPQSSYNIRKNGESISRFCDDDMQIISKPDKNGIDIKVKEGTKNKSVHLPVIVTKSGLDDITYNDFYIGDNCDILIVAGCGIHNNGTKKSGHNGIHRFYIGKNSVVRYVEKHLALGNNKTEKVLSPTTKIVMKQNSVFTMETVQLGGVTYSNRNTTAKLQDGAKLIVKEKLLTTENQIANSKFKIELLGKNCSVEVISRSVAKDNSKQKFISNLVGKTECYGRVECDGILTGKAQMISIPQIDAQNINASLVHEATIGKIAGEQLTKLMTMGLSQTEAEDLIIKGYLN